MKRVKREHYIIDGYNVVNAWPELMKFRDNLDHARDHLVDIMAEYGAFEEYNITIVFDALFTASPKSCQQINTHLQVVFTDEGETADSYIERLAYNLVRHGNEVHVVSSDWAEQTTILGVGAYRISAREMYRAVKRAKKTIFDEYTHNSSILSRHEIGGRIKGEVAIKLDKMRKRK